MPTWGEILNELNAQPQVQEGGAPDFDVVRRKYLSELHEVTGRPAIIYYSDFLTGSGPGIGLDDMQAMMECCRGIKGDGALDLVLHSPGGSAEATASIVKYLRKSYDDIRVFVPLAAMSAATMWALAANRIVMGKHSQLGPIDPQLMSDQGAIPVRAILDQFERAVAECSADPQRLGAWMPMLQQYGPALLEQCTNAENLARRLVGEWLAKYMFAEHIEAGDLAKHAADYFGDHKLHQSHSLGIDREEARGVGLVIDDLEDDKKLQDAVLSVHHATLLTMQGPCVKVVENHLGRGLYRLEVQQAIQIPTPGQEG